VKNSKLICKQEYDGFIVGKEYRIDSRCGMCYCLINEFGNNVNFSIIIDDLEDFVWYFFYTPNQHRKAKLLEIKKRRK